MGYSGERDTNLSPNPVISYTSDNSGWGSSGVVRGEKVVKKKSKRLNLKYLV